MGVFSLKENDTQAVLEVQLINPDDTPHDLSVGTPLFVFLHIKLADGTILKRGMVTTGSTTGVVVYPWVITDWNAGNLVVGSAHQMEYEVVRSVGNRITFPNDGFDTLSIHKDIGDGDDF